MPYSTKDEKYLITRIKNSNCNNIEFPKEYLEKLWKGLDFELAEKKVLLLQKALAKACLKKDYERIKKIQNKITSSFEARILAVKKVVDSHYAAGVDGIKWRKDYEKMLAVVNLTSKNYKAQPQKRIVIQDVRGLKERRIGIPTLRDRAMQILQFFALEPVAETLADRKSFAFRKGRTALDAHACLWDNLCDETCPEWVLITDVENYYESISHDWLMRNIPMDKHVLKEFLKAGVVFNGELFPTERGISLGCSISPLLR